MGIIPDDPRLLKDGIRGILNRSLIDLLILSGGLGPTEDDHSVDVLAELWEQEVIEEAKALFRLEKLSRLYPERLQLESARRQVRIPKSARPLANHLGLAPGFVLEWTKDLTQATDKKDLIQSADKNAPDAQLTRKEKKLCLLAAMPGVPREMEAMLMQELRPLIEERFMGTADKTRIKKSRRVFYLYNVGESAFQHRFFGMPSHLKQGQRKAREQAPKPLPLVDRGSLPSDFTWGVSAELAKLKIFWESENEALVRRLSSLARQEFAEHFLDRDAREALHELCVQKKIKIGTAESCTGGLAAKLITDRAGASAYFHGSIVSYANKIKESRLYVSSEIIQEHGAVSEECVLAMAQGALQALDLDFSLAVSGIAGPEGGSPEKPVGTVYFGCAAKSGNKQAFTAHYPFDREGIREQSAHSAVFYFYKFMYACLENAK